MSLGIGLGAFGVGTLVAGVGGLIKNPWKPVVPTADGLKGRAVDLGLDPPLQGRDDLPGPRHRQAR